MSQRHIAGERVNGAQRLDGQHLLTNGPVQLDHKAEKVLQVVQLAVEGVGLDACLQALLHVIEPRGWGDVGQVGSAIQPTAKSKE